MRGLKRIGTLLAASNPGGTAAEPEVYQQRGKLGITPVHRAFWKEVPVSQCDFGEQVELHRGPQARSS